MSIENGGSQFRKALLLMTILSTVHVSAQTATPIFRSAKPIWAAGLEKEKNLTVIFTAKFDAQPRQSVILRAAGASLYRIKLNGKFLGHGPARGPHGWYRIDEIDLTKKLKRGTNAVTFEVAGYNANSFYLLDQPSFLQAEIVTKHRVLASTAGTGNPFEAHISAERVQKVQRYSFQRPFTEVYQMAKPPTPVQTAVQPEKPLLPRRVPYSEFLVRRPIQVVAEGEVKSGPRVEKPWKDRALTGIGPELAGFPESELTTIPSLELQSISNTSLIPTKRPFQSTALKANDFQIVDLGVNYTGFIGARLKCKTRTRVFLTFDEILTDGDVDFKRLGCVNAVLYELEPGTYDVETIEPYTLRYLKVLALEGACEVSQLSLREYVSPIPKEAQFTASDPRLNRLFAAGVETYRQNAVDVFMDCPSRERAGWLCDSFFTARVALDLTGNTLIEKNLFEAYQLPKSFAHLPDGMLPMCYPSDHNDGVFIPNWAMWFILELEEYLKRSGDQATVQALQSRVLKLVEYLKPFKNSDGLLEKLPGWVFVEWSQANSFVQDVNYPTNMLYAEALATAGRLYGRQDFLSEAEKIRNVIRRQAFDGEFFVDNALRKEGQLIVAKNRSEVCQYFAFFFRVATPETHPKLWKTLVNDFGPKRKLTRAFAEVHPANAFIGNVLRLELLSQASLTQQLLDESLAYQLYMVDRTGTLWENDGAYASCNHGFASHGGVRVMYRDILGLHSVDSVRKQIHLRFTNLSLESCRGSMPTPHGKVELQWQKKGGDIRYSLTAPPGYKISIENLTGLALQKAK